MNPKERYMTTLLSLSNKKKTSKGVLKIHFIAKGTYITTF